MRFHFVCFFAEEGFLVCDACKTRFTGRMCEQCANGFYRYHRQCIPCECHGNTDPNSHYMCHSTLGMYNTNFLTLVRCFYKTFIFLTYLKDLGSLNRKIW